MKNGSPVVDTNFLRPMIFSPVGVLSSRLTTKPLAVCHCSAFRHPNDHPLHFITTMLSSSSSLHIPLRRLATTVSSRCASTLVVSEPLVEGVTPPGTQSTVTAAAKLGQPISLLVVGESAPSKIPVGVTKIYHVKNGDKLSESVASAIEAAVQASGDTTVVVGTSSKFGSTVIPRAAALLNASPITDILEIENESKS